jgi:GTP-binding protein
LLEGYLQERASLSAVVLLVDSRHPPLAADLQMYHWLLHYNKPLILAATKVDKLKQKDYADKLKTIGQAFPKATLVPFSSTRGTGRIPLWQAILGAVGSSPSEEPGTGGEEDE